MWFVLFGFVFACFVCEFMLFGSMIGRSILRWSYFCGESVMLWSIKVSINDCFNTVVMICLLPFLVDDPDWLSDRRVIDARENDDYSTKIRLNEARSE